MAKLTPKQMLFCHEYIIDGNATRSAEVAGYSKNTATEIGSENLTKPQIKEYIAKLRKDRAERTQITQDRVLQELAALAFGNIGEIVRWDKEGVVTIKPTNELTEQQQRFISSITHTKTTGKDEYENTKLKVDTYKKDKALELLMRHLGMMEPDDSNKQPITIRIETTEPKQ